ncbi:DUF3298 domain-containing protein [Winogradskyella sp.]|uniref:DUF3298 and DUF4163 domain-containing protein n=1 Tax=Winogradskyella sp. TaxID=1883156 RepID=UPI003BAB9F44
MKRFKFIFIFFYLLNSCETEFKPVTFKTTSIDQTYEAQISANIDKAIGQSELSKIINFKIEESIITSLGEATKKTKLEAVLEDFNSEYLEFKKDFPEASEPVWELHIETEKTYQSDAVISIAISTYEFQGGAHGNDKIKFLNLNARTGEILDYVDIIKNKDDFKNLAKTYFIKSKTKEKDPINMEDFFFGEPFQLPENMGYSDDGLVLLYNIYEVASYDQGYTEFVIPFDEAEPYLKLY